MFISTHTSWEWWFQLTMNAGSWYYSQSVQLLSLCLSKHTLPGNRSLNWQCRQVVPRSWTHASGAISTCSSIDYPTLLRASSCTGIHIFEVSVSVSCLGDWKQPWGCETLDSTDHWIPHIQTAYSCQTPPFHWKPPLHLHFVVYIIAKPLSLSGAEEAGTSRPWFIPDGFFGDDNIRRALHSTKTGLSCAPVMIYYRMETLVNVDEQQLEKL